jgi:hypothetical protein
MGFIGSLFGGDDGNSGGAGMNYQATGPQQYQLNDAWANTQAGLAQQQQFVNALQAQNGIGNQSQVFGQQQALAGQLAQTAMGAGPNPAQAQFQQNANQVAAQTAGLIGSQKGISPALQARLIAQQGAGAGQAAAGQAATLQAQQQIAAQQALMQQQANMANLSTQQVGQQANAMGNYTQGALGQQQNVLGLQGNANSSNAGVSGVTAGQQGKTFGGILSGIGSALALAHGGEVPKYADGGMSPVITPDVSGPMSNVGKYLVNGAISQAAPIIQSAPDWDPIKLKQKNDGIRPPGTESVMAGGAGDMAPGLGFGAAPVMASRGAIIGENYANQMKPVPGKASVRGDSQKNDTVNAKLSPGEVIIPRSVMQSDDPIKGAAAFVAAVMAKKGRGLPK